MTQQPYASAERVFWIVDNGSSHRGAKAVDRLAQQFPNAIMVHTPVHASWLNQIEIFFSILQRKVVTPNDFTDLTVIEKRLTDFEDRYNQTARPFRWKFTTDLNDLLARLEHHDPAEPRAA
jgi:transposase